MSGKIVLGFGNNIDYEIEWNIDKINKLKSNYEFNKEEFILNKKIDSVKSILSTIFLSLKNNSGGEYYVEDINVINEFVKYFKFKVTAGGTALRSAIALDLQEVRTTIHIVTANTILKKFIPNNCKYILGNDNSRNYPHLIIQYPSDLKININNEVIITKKSDRLIFVHDPINEQLKINKEIKKYICNSKVFLISGLNSIKNLNILNEKLSFLKECLQCLPKKSYSYYEDGCYHNDEVAKVVRKFTFNNVNICSMNEDEFLCFSNDSKFKTNPNKLMHYLVKFRRINKTKLLIIHTSNWSLVYGKNAKNYKDCLENGILLATGRMIYGDNLEKSNFIKIKKEFIYKKSSEEFSFLVNQKGDNMISCLPSYNINLKNQTTIGLGDFFVGGFLAKLVEK